MISWGQFWSKTICFLQHFNIQKWRIQFRAYQKHYWRPKWIRNRGTRGEIQYGAWCRPQRLYHRIGTNTKFSSQEHTTVYNSTWHRVWYVCDGNTVEREFCAYWAGSRAPDNLNQGYTNFFNSMDNRWRTVDNLGWTDTPPWQICKNENNQKYCTGAFNLNDKGVGKFRKCR